MRLKIANLSVPLYYSIAFLGQVEIVIEKNVDRKIDEAALFISRLIKGLQDLSCSDPDISRSWGTCTYLIEDIGHIHFRYLIDEETGDKAYVIDEAEWLFEKSHLFSTLEYQPIFR